MMMTLKTGRRGVADLDTQPGKITMTVAIVKVMEQVVVEAALVMEETLEAGTIDYTGAVREFEQATA